MPGLLHRKDAKQAETCKQLWSIARDLLPARTPGDFNQALMELGSEICLPRTPQCEVCPLRRACLARRHGKQASLPVRSRKKLIPSYLVVVGVIERGGRILIDKRRPDGLLGGLWEFPGGKTQAGESLQEALRPRGAGGDRHPLPRGRLIATVDHAYSHFRIRLHAFRCTYVSGTTAMPRL
jgi:A/G-specific adenine glycosylase